MFFKNLKSAAEFALFCKSPLFLQNSHNLGNVRLQIRKFFHNTRRTVQRPFSRPSPLDIYQCVSGPLHGNSLLKPFLFTVGVTSLSLAGCMIWEYENSCSDNTFIKRLGGWLNPHQRQSKGSEPGPIKKWWHSLNDIEKVFYPILAANILVFSAWQFKALTPFMVKYFCSNPASKTKCLPMFLSTFSHYSPIHLAANMYVLYSFMPAAFSSLGKEQFVAMYLSGGVISSLASYTYKVLLKQPGLSLGASGAIMSVLAYVCLEYPDIKLNFILLPMYTFAASTALKVIMSIDLAGVALGWKVFDHAAHLGGALFGLFWCDYGYTLIWENRDKFLEYYHNLRKGSKS